MTKEPHHLLFTADKHENAQTHTMCRACGAPVGEPCIIDAYRPAISKIHALRVHDYGAWLRNYHTNYRSKAETA